MNTAGAPVRGLAHAGRATSERPLKVLVVKVADIDSSEEGVLRRILEARAEGIAPTVIYHSWGGNRDAAVRFAATGTFPVRFADFGWRPTSRTGRGLLSRLLEFWRLFVFGMPRAFLLALRLRPDAIYSSQQRWDCFIATLLAIALRRPQVMHLHYLPGPHLGRVAQWRLRRAALVVCVSEFISQEAIQAGCLPERLAVIPNPVLPAPPASQASRAETRAELGIANDAVLIGVVARLDPEKGQRDVLAALARMRYTSAWCVVVGDGPDRAHLHELAESLGLSSSVRLLGFRSDVHRLLGAMDIFVHPSLDEPFGLAVAEASAAGLPVVAYRHGATPELVAEGQTGLLAEASDIQGLAERLDALSYDPELRTRLGTNGVQHVAELFDVGTTGARFAKTLRMAFA